MKTSQKQNILRHLLYSPLCGQEQDWSLGRRFPARIHELRGKGFPIEKRRCDQGHNHRTHQIEFYLDKLLSGVSPQVVLFSDWCSDCGRSGRLVYTDAASCTVDDWIWLPVACDSCGKGDWR